MDWKVFITVFGTVFLAELGDKSQMATMLFASDSSVGKHTVFIAALLALVVSVGIGVLAGSLLGEFINPKYLQYIAGAGFITIGVITIASA